MDSVQVQILTGEGKIERLYNFIRQFPLDYPDYFEWLQKCKRELELGYKKAFYVTNSNGEIIGSIIFQPHKKESSVLEIKNLRIHPLHEHRGLGSVLESSVELYAKENDFQKIQCDVRQENPVLFFMQKRGYRVKSKERLYGALEEIVLQKDVLRHQLENQRPQV